MEKSEMNYYQTFIQVAPDCPVAASVIPVGKGEHKPVHLIQYELLGQNPYTFTQEELLFEVHVRHKGISASELKARRKELWAEFFAKPQACLRSSALPKKYGWGVHFDAQGKIALYPMESREYQTLVQSSQLKVLSALRSKRG